MDESEQVEYDKVQAEKAELGIPTETVDQTEVQTPEEPAIESETKVEEKTEEEPDPEEASNRVTPKDFKEYKKTLREELQADYDAKLEKLREEVGKAKPSETATTNLEDDVKELAAKLEFDEEKTKAIIEVARKGLEPLSKEDKELLEEYKKDRVTREDDRVQKEQEEIFDTDWKSVLPDIKKAYPNASDEQIEAARQKMDELSHTDKYNLVDLDYILFKEKDTFTKTLFSPKQATFESARPVSFDESDEFPEFNPNMSPAQFAAFEKKRESAMESMPSEKLRVTTRDDRGNIVERYE